MSIPNFYRKIVIWFWLTIHLFSDFFFKEETKFSRYSKTLKKFFKKILRRVQLIRKKSKSQAVRRQTTRIYHNPMFRNTNRYPMKLDDQYIFLETSVRFKGDGENDEKKLSCFKKSRTARAVLHRWDGYPATSIPHWLS